MENYTVGYQVICSSCVGENPPLISQQFFVTPKEVIEYAEEWNKHYEKTKVQFINPVLGLNYSWKIEFYKVCVYDAVPNEYGKVGIYYITEEEVKSRIS